MGHIAIMAPDHPKRLRAPNQFGKMIVDLSTGEARDEALRDDSPTVAFARQGGLKGGNARAEKLTRLQTSEIARKSARLRWEKTR